MARRRLKAIDLFSGCGGTTLGLRNAGFNVVAGVELDPLAADTYVMNHPRVKLWVEDVRDLDPGDILSAFRLRRGELDLLAGCPPCQAFSSLRRLNGGRRVYDPARKNLTLEFLKFVQAMLPKVVLLENVPGIETDYRMPAILRSLEGLGYSGKPSIFNAADFGVPQRRNRFILIASRVGEIGYANPTGNCVTVSDTIRHLPKPGSSGDPLHDYPEKRSARVRMLISNIPHDGGSRAALGEEYVLECHREFAGFRDVYGRMSWDRVAPTITGGCVNPSKGRFLHPDQDRAITLREAALLQSFPSDYKFSLGRGKHAAAKMIGNAFPPRFVEAHAKGIARHLRQLQS